MARVIVSAVTELAAITPTAPPHVSGEAWTEILGAIRSGYEAYVMDSASVGERRLPAHRVLRPSSGPV